MRYPVLALSLLACAVPACAQEAPPPQDAAPEPGHGRIVNGHRAAPHSVPWQVELFRDRTYAPETNPHNHYCGGALIAPDWVLTAGHCMDVADLKVRLGTQDLALPGEVYAIDRTYVHPGFVLTGQNHDHRNDLALLHITRAPKAANTRDIATIPLLEAGSPKPLMPNDPVSVTGWGSTLARTDRQDIYALASALQQAELNINPPQDCDHRAMLYASRNAWKLGDNLVCASGVNDQGLPIDTCQGDSGGPLVRSRNFGPHPNDPVLVAIVTFGIGCGYADHPGYYTKVAPYADWIRRQLASLAAVPA